MYDKQALFVGCSFTDGCGFTVENKFKYLWPYLVGKHIDHSVINKAIGGMSNHEIFTRTLEAVNTQRYDLVVVMWSEVSRMWAYCSRDNIDDYTIMNNGRTEGFNSDKDYVKAYSHLHNSKFNNIFVKIKHWLMYCLALERYLKTQQVQYVFIKGFENHINDFNHVKYHNGFINANNIKLVLDLDNQPDDVILQKINIVKNLISAQDHNHWLNLYDLSFYGMRVDFADDQSHPGPVSNANLAKKFIDFYDSLNKQHY